ncbi:cell number regulator 10-like [Quercus suber]|uniref:cell number regulator 10-like n=1 Tax=Quercus suber TaxID=58331 RepID=UPI0032E04BCA
MNPNGVNHSTPYPPPPTSNRAQPVQQTPHQSPQPSPMYQNGPNEPTTYPPQGPTYQQGPVAGAAVGVPMQQNQYQMQVPAQAGTQGWTSGLFDCMNNPTNESSRRRRRNYCNKVLIKFVSHVSALITACVPCVTFGQIAEIVDNGQTTCSTSGLLYRLIAMFIGIPCIMSSTYRTKLRGRFGLTESPAPDWITHFFCEPCALCQEYGELQARGIDPSLGNHACT